jgi:hypothetical protein
MNPARLKTTGDANMTALFLALTLLSSPARAASWCGGMPQRSEM